MNTVRPIDCETVWIEYPEGKHFEAIYDAKADTHRHQSPETSGSGQV